MNLGHGFQPQSSRTQGVSGSTNSLCRSTRGSLHRLEARFATNVTRHPFGSHPWTALGPAMGPAESDRVQLSKILSQRRTTSTMVASAKRWSSRHKRGKQTEVMNVFLVMFVFDWAVALQHQKWTETKKKGRTKQTDRQTNKNV